MTSPKHVDAAHMLAMQEWMRGERGHHGDFYIAGLQDTSELSGRAGMYAFIRPEQSDHEWAETPVSKLEKMADLIERDHDKLLLAAWGGPQAQQTLEAFVAQRHSDDMPIVAALRIEHDQVWEATEFYADGTVGPWHHQGAMPDVSEHMIPAGFKPPASTPAERVAGLQPVDDPLPSLEDKAAETIRLVPPSSRVESSQEILDSMVYAASEDIDEPQIRNGDIQVLSQCVASNVVVRDAVAAYAAEQQTRIVSLIDAYRHAPIENRAAMSGCVATANSLAGGATETTEILALPASYDVEHIKVAAQATRMGASGDDPAPVKTALRMGLPDALDTADSAFMKERERELTVQTAALNPPSAETTSPAGPGV